MLVFWRLADWLIVIPISVGNTLIEQFISQQRLVDVTMTDRGFDSELRQTHLRLCGQS